MSRGAGSSRGPSLAPFVLLGLCRWENQMRMGGGGDRFSEASPPPVAPPPLAAPGPSGRVRSLSWRRPPSLRPGPGTAWRRWRPARHPALRPPRFQGPVRSALRASEGGLNVSRETLGWLPREAPYPRMNPSPSVPPATIGCNPMRPFPGLLLAWPFPTGLRARSEPPSSLLRFFPLGGFSSFWRPLPSFGKEDGWFFAARGPTGGTCGGLALPSGKLDPSLWRWLDGSPLGGVLLVEWPSLPAS